MFVPTVDFQKFIKITNKTQHPKLEMALKLAESIKSDKPLN